MSIHDEQLLRLAADLARAYLSSLSQRPVGAQVTVEALRAALGRPLAEEGTPAPEVIATLAQGADAGLVASAGPRYFGFVIGGNLPVALAADWLTSAWDQNAGLYVSSPAAAVVEETAAAWLLDILGLPATASAGFVTGATMANFTALAAGRHEVLARVGWNVAQRGLIGAPPVHVVVGDEVHITILAALSMLGLGTGQVKRVPADEQGRMRSADLSSVLRTCDGPTIICAQAGNVNTGAFDPLAEITALSRAHGAWLHVDGAFGLWAAASPALRHHLTGVAQADSWALDAHKWLNVPYDCGIVFVARQEAHRAAMRATAAYLVAAERTERDPYDWTPEFSRRARGFAVYAALRFLGRRGVTDLIERCCHLARRMGERLGGAPGVTILNQVVLNQVLVRFHPPAGGDGDRFTDAVIARVQQEGTCWLGGTTWHGVRAMRISVSNWTTTAADIDQSAEAILEAAWAEAGEFPAGKNG